MAVSSINIASSTGKNWLKEAQESVAASEQPGGLLGALQDMKNGSSTRAFLAKSASAASALAQITQGTAQSSSTLTLQMADAAKAKRMQERAALIQKLNPSATNFTPPKGLDPILYLEDGSTIDTVGNVLTMANGTQIDTTTGLQIIDSKSMVQLANGAYLDLKNNVLTMSDGTKIDTVTGLKRTV